MKKVLPNEFWQDRASSGLRPDRHFLSECLGEIDRKVDNVRT
jgi:hypothetical protein